MSMPPKAPSHAPSTGGVKRKADDEERRLRPQEEPERAMYHDECNRFIDMLLLTLQDAVWLSGLGKEVVKAEDELDKDFCREVCDYTEKAWKKFQRPVMFYLEMFSKKPYKGLAIPKPTEKSCLNAKERARMDAKTFADQAVERESLLQHIAQLCSATVPLYDDGVPAKRIKGEEIKEAKHPISRTSVTISGSGNTQAALLAEKEPKGEASQSLPGRERPAVSADTYTSANFNLADCEKHLQLLLLCRFAAVHICNAKLVSGSDSEVSEFHVMYSKLFPATVMDTNVMPSALWTIQKYGGLPAREQAGLPLLLQDKRDWEEIKARGNKILDYLLDAVFKLPQLKRPDQST